MKKLLTLTLALVLMMSIAVAATAEKVIMPPVMALPMQRMSGVIPAHSQANIRPVRPKPVAISSAMRSMPSSSQRQRRE